MLDAVLREPIAHGFHSASRNWESAQSRFRATAM